MGIGSWLLELGVRAEGLVQQLGVRQGSVPLSWPVGTRGSLIYRLPRDPHQRASIFADVQTIVVQDGEIAVVLEDGKAQGTLEPGRYTFQKARVTGSLDVIWLSAGQQTLKWGVGNVTSVDQVQVSANGVVYLRVIDAGRFVHEVVQGAVTLAELDLQRFLLPRLQGVLRTTLARFEAVALQSEREVFADTTKKALGTALEQMGLSIVDLEVVEIGLPAEFKAAIQQATMVGHTNRAHRLEAEQRIQLQLLEAQASAQAQLTAGLAQAQVMAQLQAQGIDPLKLRALDALQTFASTPAQGPLIGTDPRVAVFGQVAMAALQPGAPPAPPPIHALPAQAPIPATVVQPEPPAAPVETSADIERQIDALVERLAEGKISEDTYNKLVARLEGKLARIRGG
jgi:regulator of protease activity HflC (stomatin/prohibitin superfamily)